MWHTAGRYNGSLSVIGIGRATSADGVAWMKDAANPMEPARLGYARGHYEYIVSKPWVLRGGAGGAAAELQMWFSFRGTSPKDPNYRIGYATNSGGAGWVRWSSGLNASGSGWNSEMVEYATVLRGGGGYRMWYSGSAYHGIGYATMSALTVCTEDGQLGTRQGVVLPSQCGRRARRW
jgi:hypothetical protein